ncbi:MAG TPA: Crp/Fnr family transcriptional regulator [Kofleriaceae bacterium]|nr:Crp/Fnr family transcriptional regulator [Kofleriaceae bacterium]
MAKDDKHTLGSLIKGTAPVRALGRRAVAALDQRERLAAPGGRARAGAWALSRVRLLDAVPEAELVALAPDAEVCALARRRSSLLDEADERVWVVLEGGVKLCRVGLAGKRLVEAILGPGDLFGRISAGAERASYEVEALEPTRIAALARDRFEELLRRHPDLACCVVQELEDRQRRLVRRLEALVFKDVRARVAETLLELTREHGQPCPHGFAIDLRISQDDLAELVGASRQMVNRVIGEMTRRLYVQRMGRILCVLHRDRLERLASAPGDGAGAGL